MKWIYTILFAIDVMLIGAQIELRLTHRELAPVITQAFEIIRGDHRAMMMGDYDSLKGIHEGKTKKIVKRKGGRK